jgi:O-acetyl-ADP-ribose deacetylase (regulator of RNase III)
MKHPIIIKISTLLLLVNIFFVEAKSKTNVENSRYISIEQRAGEKITNVDVIVNPANQWLQHGGGIAGALSKAAGDCLQEKSDRIIQSQPNGTLAIGSVVVTESYALSKQGIKKIFHAVGPDCRNSEENKNRKKLLKRTYKNIFAQLKKEGLKSIAIPSISTGIFGYPDADEATDIAVSFIVKAFKNGFDITIFANDKQTIDRYFKALLGKGAIFAVST